MLVSTPEDPIISKYYLNGYSRFSPECRQFAVSAAVVSRVAEGFQAELLHDNRVGFRMEALWEAANKELRWVIDLPDHLWSGLSKVSPGLSPVLLKDSCIGGSHCSYHFIWRRVLQPACQYPWKLCRGNISEKLDDLASLETPPPDPCTTSIWQLLQDDKFPRPQVEAAVRLLAECSWSSMPAEQQHASVSQLHRWHKEYGLEQLVSRGLMHQTVRLLPHVSKTAKQVSSVIRKMEKVEAKAPQKASASHMMVQSLIQVVKGKKDFLIP